MLWNACVAGAIKRRNMGPDDCAALDAWMLTLSHSTSGGTNFNAAFTDAGAFFAGAGIKRRTVIFVTDGEPNPASSVDAARATIASLPPMDIFGFDIALANTSFTARIDNTPVDGVPVTGPPSTARYWMLPHAALAAAMIVLTGCVGGDCWRPAQRLPARGSV